jgi:hypothetical protein
MESYFKQLLTNIKLTDPQRLDGKRKIKSVATALHNYYYPTLTYDGSTKRIIGSYGKRTNIRPVGDIDLIFRMPAEEYDRYNNLSGNKQSQLLQDIRIKLKDKFTTTEKIRAFGKVIVIGFSDGTHNLELLPAWKQSDGKFIIPNSENGGSWDVWDPIKEFENIDGSSKRTKKTRSLIRMFKRWVEYNSVPIKSFMVEILVVEYLKANSFDDSFSKSVKKFFDFLLTKKNSSVYSPASSSFINLGEAWYTKVESVVTRATKAIDFEAKGDFENSSREWKKVFGDVFPLAVNKSTSVVQGFSIDIQALSIRYPSVDEEDLESKYGIEQMLIPEYRVNLDADVSQDGFRTGSLVSFLAQKFPIMKRKNLLFKATTNVPGPYKMMWKVRNFGEEAKRANGLRGEITYDAGFRQKKESTLYEGGHYVECYVIKNGFCVAVGTIHVPIISSYE